MNETEALNKALSYSESASIKSIINRTLIVEWGTIKKIVSDGVVEVLLSVTDKKENTTVIVCTLINPCSSSLSINLKPKVGDKVLVLSPRRFDVDMFDVSSAQVDDTEVIVEPNFTGYNKLCCVAILYNQFRSGSHKNTIVVDNDGAMSVKLAYNKQDDKNKLTFTSDKDGAYSIVNEKSSVSMTSDGYLSYTNTDNSDNKSRVVFTSSGFTIQDKNECKIISSSTDIQINGKLKIKK